MTPLTHSSKSYQHEPLEHSRRSIRLCRFVTDRPSSKRSAIELEIAHYTLHNVNKYDYYHDNGFVFANFEEDDRVVSYVDQNGSVQYTNYAAVSYCWGQGAASRMISLNGCDFAISQNLHDLLGVLRNEPYNGRLYWIDQLCINQSDVHERNHQVSLMSFIYSSAESTHVWLGDATPETSLGLRMLEQLESPGNGCKHACKANDTAGLTALRGLLTREYWTRLWIVQEVIYTRKLFFLCGQHRHQVGRNGKPDDLISWAEKISADSEYSTVSAVTRHEDESQSNVDPDPSFILPRTLELLRDWSFMLDVRKAHGDGPGYLNSFGVVEDHAWRKCRDPRDRIFGLQGLVSPGWGVTVDYTKSKQEVFEEWVAQAKDSSHGGISEPELRKVSRVLYEAMEMGDIEEKYLDRLTNRSSGPEYQQRDGIVWSASSSRSLLKTTAQLVTNIIWRIRFAFIATICALCLYNGWLSKPQ